MRGHERCVELFGEHFPPPHLCLPRCLRQTPRAPRRLQPDRLPAVTVNPPEARPRNRPKPARRERSARNPAAVQPSAPVAPQVSSGVTLGIRDRRAGIHATHRRQRHDHQRRGGERAALLARRRGAGGGAGADRHPAFRRRQSQPVFSARLQSRPRHRSRHQGRRHARQHADPWPRAGLCRYQFHDSRN